jgi:hypothetical protein
MCACVSKNFVWPGFPRTNSIIRAEKQNYNSAIELAHISIAKFGWLSVTQSRSAVRYGAWSLAQSFALSLDPSRLSSARTFRML